MSGGRARSVALQHQRLKRGTGMRRPMPTIGAFTVAARCSTQAEGDEVGACGPGADYKRPACWSTEAWSQ
jgi:hypothetical protein